MKKIFVCFIFVLFIGLCTNSSVAGSLERKSTLQKNCLNTLFVGDSSENFSNEQESLVENFVDGWKTNYFCRIMGIPW